MEYATREQAQQAIQTLSNQSLMGRLVYVREVSCSFVALSSVALSFVPSLSYMHTFSNPTGHDLLLYIASILLDSIVDPYC